MKGGPYMPETTKKIFVTRDLRPSYYDAFHCLAEGCRISCCKGWLIGFDKKDYLSLKRLQGSARLNRLLAQGIRRIRGNTDNAYYAEFSMESGVCPFLREDCLCAIQVEKEHTALPAVCQIFPRTESYQPSGYLERSVSPACEGVLDLLWDLPDGVDFLSDPLPDKRRHGTFEFKSQDFLAVHFQEIRSWCIDQLQDRRRPLPERILRIGLALKELADGERDIPRWLRRAEALANNTEMLLEGYGERNHLLPLYLSNNLRILATRQENDADFEALQSEILLSFAVVPGGKPGSARQDISTAPWLAACERFQKNFAGREYFMENLMTAVFFHLHFPDLKDDKTSVWKSYVNFCNLYAFFRFMAVMSCRETSAGDRDALFRSIVHASRMLLHNSGRMNALRDEFFDHDSATLAHMAVLLSG